MRNERSGAIAAFILLVALVPIAQAVDVQADLKVDVQADVALPQTPGMPAAPEADASSPTIELPALALDTRTVTDALVAIDAGNVAASAGARGGLESSSRDSVTAESPTTTQGAGGRMIETIGPVAVKHAPTVVATAGFLALLQSLGAFRWLAAGGVALYSRLAKSEMLDNTHRDKVYKLIQEKPGMGMTELCNATGLGWGTIVYHLDRLERAKYITSERAGLHRCYFPIGTLARETRKGIGALKADTTRSIAEYLINQPGATQSELCAALGMTASAASKQVSKLESAGLVRRERAWKTVHLYPEETLQPLVGGGTAPTMATPLAA